MLSRTIKYFILKSKKTIEPSKERHSEQLNSLINSQFHYNGYTNFKKSKDVAQYMNNCIANIEKLLTELTHHRQQLLKLNANNKNKDFIHKHSLKTKQLLNYQSQYHKLVQAMQQCRIDNQWSYKIVGWYNITPLITKMIERMLQANLAELQSLISAVGWMKHNWRNAYGKINYQLTDHSQIQNFYNNLYIQISLPNLRKLQTILVTSLTYSKRKYLQNYFKKYLDNNCSHLKTRDSSNISDLVWLFEASVRSMNDTQSNITSFQQKLLQLKPKLKEEDIQLLMNAYILKGKINAKIYSQYIKPYIMRNKMMNLSNLIATIQFVICSECGDGNLLKLIYEMIQIYYRPGSLENSKDFYTLHLYTHYLRIKGYHIKLTQNLEREIVSFCKNRAEGRSSLNQIVFQNKNHLKHQYMSWCLNTNSIVLKQYDCTASSNFQNDAKQNLSDLKFQNTKIYQKPVFCCFQLDFCLFNELNSELMDLQILGIQYVFASGKLIRQRQVRDELLSYYGFHIKHLNQAVFKTKINLAQQLSRKDKKQQHSK